ncbi:MAG: hypothetical protein FWB72_01335 [Firmicutes bacterium]|nr:hypothetical protein [Bacillota bacterium]
MTKLNIASDSNWEQNIVEIVKSKGDEVFVLSRAEYNLEMDKAKAWQWLMEKVEKSREDIKNGRYTSYTIEELRAGKFTDDVMARVRAKHQGEKE